LSFITIRHQHKLRVRTHTHTHTHTRARAHTHPPTHPHPHTHTPTHTHTRKVFGKEYVNLLVGGYFFLIGILGATRALRPVGLVLTPGWFTESPYHLDLTQQKSKAVTDSEVSSEKDEGVVDGKASAR
jgi:hypothetical protein